MIVLVIVLMLFQLITVSGSAEDTVQDSKSFKRKFVNDTFRFETTTSAIAYLVRIHSNGSIPADHRNMSMELMHKHTVEWCQYISSTREPDVLFYPKLPKAGSSTMERIFKFLSKKNAFTTHLMQRNYWGDIDTNELTQEYLFSLIKDHTDNYGIDTNDTDPLLITGHIFNTNTFAKYHHHSQSKLNDKELVIEHIQLLRECNARTISNFFYQLLFSSEALKAAKRYENAKRISHFFTKVDSGNTPQGNRSNVFLIFPCLRDRNCLARYKHFDPKGVETLAYLCGPHCARAHQDNQEAGATEHVINPKHFTVVGMLERIEDYLATLECVYPTMFEGILEYYQKKEVHDNEHRSSLGGLVSPTLVNFVRDEVCHERNNSYRRVFDSIQSLLEYRFHYLSSHREECCRVKRVRNSFS